MAEPTPNNTLSVKLTPITLGSTPPAIADNAFTAAIGRAKAGGDATQAYFDAINQTADYWSWLAETNNQGRKTWADGTDPAKNPIQMSSNGNLDVRMGAFYRPPAQGLTAHVADSDDPPTFGIATIQTHNTTTAVSSDITFGLGLAGIPPGIILSKALFGDLIKPIYNNLKLAVNKMASKFKESAEVEEPSIDPEEEAEEPLDEADGDWEIIGGELAEEGAENLSISWGSVAGEAAGLGALAAIPLIVQFLAHKMVNSVMVHNLTDVDFTWSILSQEHGKASVLPDPKTRNIIPKMDYNVDSWGDKTTVKVAYEARMAFINSTDYTDIGWVLGLQPSDGNPQTAVVVNIPWAGSNVLWTGASAGSADQMWQQHGLQPDGQLAKTSTVGAYRTTVSINKLRGETDGAYFYGVVVVIEPAKS